MLTWTYITAIIEPPGTVAQGLAGHHGERRTGPGSGIWWQNRRDQVAKAALASVGRHDKESSDEDMELPKRSAACTSCGDNETDAVRAGMPTLRVSKQRRANASDDRLGSDELDLSASYRFCRKCPPVTLAYALSLLPPELRMMEKRNREACLREAAAECTSLHDKERLNTALRASADDESEMEIRAWLGSDSDNMVVPPKPERAHHCRTCKACVLKYDHHCPWINQCVGVGNERYFILFMLWFAVGTAFYCVAGWPLARSIMWAEYEWPSQTVPRILFLVIYALCAVMGFAVLILACWHLAMVMRGETSVENQDNSHYRSVAKERNESFTNVYNLGLVRNLQLFFNVGPGTANSYWTLFLPVRIAPYSDGWHWAKRAGMAGRHGGIHVEEELTDDEGEGEDH
ncbi:protein S-acyltransferase [Malassezia sp. CBS 17886]|nr:protein S-acyltransferase [Malassezia sp. CBS 17886]